MTVARMDELDDIRIGHEKKGRYLHDRFGAVRQEAGYIVPPDKQDELDNYLRSLIVGSFSVTSLRAAPGISNSQAATPTAVVCAETRDLSEYNEALTEADLKRLRAILEHEVTDNTKINYRAQWRRFAEWADEREVSVLPADPVHVAAYLAQRFELLRHKPATLRVASAAIGFMHRSVGFDDPCDTEEVRKTLSGATRKAGSHQSQAEGLTARALEAIRTTACISRRGRGGNYEREDTARRRGRMDIAIISLMRDALLRVSEASALRWSDIEEEDDGTGRLLIRRSKTDAEGEGAIVFISALTMANLEEIRGEASDADPIFGLCRNQISRRIKQAAKAAGLGDGFSGHSPRVGMARDLARAGTELPRLMTAGRWRSPRMPALYTRNETVARGAVAQYYGSENRPHQPESRRAGDRQLMQSRDCLVVGNVLVNSEVDHASEIYDRMSQLSCTADRHEKTQRDTKCPITAIMGLMSSIAETISNFLRSLTPVLPS